MSLAAASSQRMLPWRLGGEIDGKAVSQLVSQHGRAGLEAWDGLLAKVRESKEVRPYA